MPDGMMGLMGGPPQQQAGPPQQQGIPPQQVAQIAQRLLQMLGPQGCAMLVQMLTQALQGGGGGGQGGPPPGM